MIKLEIQTDEKLAKWLVEAAAENDVTPEEFIELLIKMESGLSNQSRDGRRIIFRASMYRGYGKFLIDDQSQVGQS